MTDEPLTEADAIQALLDRDTDRPAETETPDPEEPALEAEPEEIAAEEEPTDDAEVVEEASEDEAEEPEAPQEPQLITVKVDGREQRVTLEELTRSYSGQASIQRRIQEAETLRQQTAAAVEAFQREYQNLQALAQQAQTTGLLPPPQPPNPALAQQNPEAYVRALADYQGKAATYQQQQARLQHARETQAHLAEAQQAALRQEQAERLAGALPEFANPETRAALRERLVRTAETYGISADELDGVIDARQILVLEDARKWREHQARVREAKRPTPTPTPRHAAPSKPTPPMSAADKARLAFHKSGSVEDAARFLLARDNP